MVCNQLGKTHACIYTYACNVVLTAVREKLSMTRDVELTGVSGPDAEARKPQRPWATPRVIVSQIAKSQKGSATPDAYTINGSPFYLYVS